MFTQLAATISLALLCAASPVVVVRDNNIKMPITRSFNISGDKTLADIDRARVQTLVSRAKKSASKAQIAQQAGYGSADATNIATIYTVAVSLTRCSSVA